MGFSFRDSPTFSVTLVLSSVIFLTSAAATVSFAFLVTVSPLENFTVTVSSVSPERIALILPLPSTVAYLVLAMEKLLEDTEPVVFKSAPFVSPAVIFMSESVAELVSLEVTVKVMDAVLLPSFREVALIVVLPVSLAVTLPLPSTDATEGLEDSHFTEPSAPAGSAVMESCTVSPFLALVEPLILMLPTATSAFFTSTVLLPLTPPAVAVTVTLPALTPVTFPPSTVAMLLSEELQLTPSYEAPEGEMVADSVMLPPTLTEPSPVTSTFSTFFSSSTTFTLALAV